MRISFSPASAAAGPGLRLVRGIASRVNRRLASRSDGRSVRNRFSGHIAGAGTASGTRLVLGCWGDSPLGSFADVMVAHPDGIRELIAPTREVAEFVAGTYTFDRVRVAPVSVERVMRGGGVRPGGTWHVTAGPLTWSFGVGRRHPWGWVFRVIPRRLGLSRGFARLTDAAAGVLMPGVRTLGSAGSGRVEWYAPRDLHRIRWSRAAWEGRDLGALADVAPAPRFGFGSTPRTPCLTTLTSTVEVLVDGEADDAEAPARDDVVPAPASGPEAADAAPAADTAVGGPATASTTPDTNGAAR